MRMTQHGVGQKSPTSFFSLWGASIFSCRRMVCMLSILTVRQRELVTLYYIDGLGIKEIAKICGISFQAVSIALSESRKKFEKNREKIKKLFEIT